MSTAGLLAANRSEGSSTATSGGGQSSQAGTATSSVAVTRQDLVARTEVDGILGYAGALSVAGQVQGTVTAVPKAGTVLERGQSLYSVDNRPVTLFLGDLPAWRRLAAGMADGPDVKQLELKTRLVGRPVSPDFGLH